MGLFVIVHGLLYCQLVQVTLTEKGNLGEKVIPTQQNTSGHLAVIDWSISQVFMIVLSYSLIYEVVVKSWATSSSILTSTY